MNTTNPVAHEVFQILDGVSDLTLTAHRLKAVTTAFAETFTEDSSGADVEEIRNRPEHFCYLFDALRELVLAIDEQAEALSDQSGEYLQQQRAQQQTA